jgi:hypothetical protein
VVGTQGVAVSISNRVAGLSLKDLAALKRRLDGMRGEEKASEPFLQPTRTRDRSLSFLQERLWFLDQLGLVGAAYNVPLALHLEGELNRAALQMSVGEVVRRHESLRTHIESIEGEPMQVIDAPQPHVLELVDLSEMEEPERTVRVHGLQQAEATHGFDLSTGPLFRAVLLKLGAREHVLLVTMHHIISDGWSLSGVLRSELSVLYAAFVQGRSSPLPEFRSNMQTMRCGSGSGCRERCCRSSCNTGSRNSRGQASYWTCRRIGYVPRCRVIVGRWCRFG